jgi:hypothetical protein
MFAALGWIWFAHAAKALKRCNHMTPSHHWTGEFYIASIGHPSLPTLARGEHRRHIGLQWTCWTFGGTQTFVDFGGTILLVWGLYKSSGTIPMESFFQLRLPIFDIALTWGTRNPLVFVDLFLIWIFCSMMFRFV